MYTFAETGNGVSAFLAKLWRLVEDPETNHLICWAKDGRSFVIQNQARFAREVLPLNYKHNNMASFVRQLNMYGFHKITSIENGALKFDRDDIEFSHPCFKRSHPYLLEHIKRKITNVKIPMDTKAVVKTDAISKVLQDMKAIRGRQDSLDTRFALMKQENEALWSEIATLREKHSKQQQLVQRVLNFLVTMVQTKWGTSSVKRLVQLMIDDAPQNIAKLRKITEMEQNNGPVIHELDEELLDETTYAEPDFILPSSPFEQTGFSSQPDIEMVNSPNITERPRSSASVISLNCDNSNQSAEGVINYIENETFNANNQNALESAIDSDDINIIYHVSAPSDANVPVTTTITTTSSKEDNLSTSLLHAKYAVKPIVYANNATIIPENYRKRKSMKKHSLKKGESKVPKSKKKFDPMTFLNDYSDNSNTETNNLIESDLSKFTNAANDLQSSISISENNSNSKAKAQVSLTNADLLDSNTDLINFLGNEIGQTNIFDDSSILSAADENNFDRDETLNLLETQQYESETADDGAFRGGEQLDPFIPITCEEQFKTKPMTDKNIEKEEQIAMETPSTSKNIVSSSTVSSAPTDLALTKYNENERDGNMRLSTFNEVNGHLNSLQDDLDSLKDLLRASDLYTLDANALVNMQGDDPLSCLMEYNKIQNLYNSIENNSRILLSPGTTLDGRNVYKLFNDSDILSPYGFNYANDDGCEKKGNELMAYQPVCDFSDIFNDQNELQESETNETPKRTKSDISYSPLNTPLHTDE